MPLTAVAALLVAVVWSRRHYFEVLLKSRVQTGGRSENAHFAVYDFVPQVIHSHPLFGLGLNTFSVYYEFVTGKSNWGPHSFYVALIVETGLVGAVVFLLFLRYLFLRLRASRELGRRFAAEGLALARRVRPLAWGMTAALAGTMAANFFYLTMQFYYFYAFAVLVLALPIVFAQRGAPVISERSSATFAAAITWTIAGLFFTTALVIAYVIPFHAQDALTFGEWSRLISADWHFHYPTVTGQEYGRPLFYVLQGGLWGAIGVDDPRAASSASASRCC